MGHFPWQRLCYIQRAHIHIYYIYGPVSRVPTPPMGWGGVWCPCGGVYTYIHTYIPTYLPTYLRTYIHTITLPYITLPYLTLPYLTFHTYIHTYIHRHTHIHTYTDTHTHTYIHTSIHTNIPTYQHTSIPTYQPTTTTGHRGGDQKNHTTTTGHKGGGPEEPDDTVHPYPLVGGGGGVANAAPYIYKYIQFYSISTVVKFTRGKDAQRLDLLNWCQVVQAFQVLRDSKLKELGSRW